LQISEKRKRVTIKDVAKAAGVSTQTVSRVMNKFSYVSEETRQRVEGVVERLGYHPSTLARSLIQQRSYTLGIVTYGLKYIGPSRTLNGIADQADKLGYTLMMKELDNFATSHIDEVIDSLLARQVDGIIWAVPEIGDNHAGLDERLENISIPVIFLATEPRKGISSVVIDNYQGALMATQHLLDIGKKRIGHISGPLSWWEAQERKRGWRDTLSKNGMDASEHKCAEGNWSSASGENAFMQLLDSYPDMDAIFVGNDQMALGVLRQSHCQGIRIPDQLAIVGFDNIAESAYFYPSLTTVYQNLQQLGEQAVQNIVDLIKSHQENKILPPRSIFLKPTLIVRESSMKI
jgi:LacI family transcriptional regulator